MTYFKLMNMLNKNNRNGNYNLGYCSYDPAILLLGIYPDKTIIQKDTCTPMFIAALFTIAKTWKQPKCPLTDEWIKMWYIYTMEYYSAKKKKKIMSFAATWMQLEIIILSEVSQKEEGSCTHSLKKRKRKKRTCLKLSIRNY